jgi:hypothetical protein
MRRSFAAVMLVAVLAGTAACAHPHEVPKPGESTSAVSTPKTTASSDETGPVCTQAQSASNQAVADLTAQLTAAQSALSAGNQVAALAAAAQAKSIASDWKTKLQGFANRPIKSSVRDVLTRGIALIDGLLNANPQTLDATKAQQQVNGFLDDLKAACS